MKTAHATALTGWAIRDMMGFKIWHLTVWLPLACITACTGIQTMKQ